MPLRRSLAEKVSLLDRLIHTKDLPGGGTPVQNRRRLVTLSPTVARMWADALNEPDVIVRLIDWNKQSMRRLRKAVLSNAALAPKLSVLTEERWVHIAAIAEKMQRYVSVRQCDALSRNNVHVLLGWEATMRKAPAAGFGAWFQRTPMDGIVKSWCLNRDAEEQVLHVLKWRRAAARADLAESLPSEAEEADDGQHDYAVVEGDADAAHPKSTTAAPVEIVSWVADPKDSV